MVWYFPKPSKGCAGRWAQLVDDPIRIIYFMRGTNPGCTITTTSGNGSRQAKWELNCAYGCELDGLMMSLLIEIFYFKIAVNTYNSCVYNV